MFESLHNIGIYVATTLPNVFVAGCQKHLFSMKKKYSPGGKNLTFSFLSKIPIHLFPFLLFLKKLLMFLFFNL